MVRKNYFTAFLALALFVVGNIVVSAQTAPVTGRVEIKKADGTTAPAVGATVEVYRMDIKSKLPSDKTGKKGEFSFAGLPLGATFVLSVSGPGIAPQIYPNVRAGSENLVISTTEGDGKKWTEEEVRQGATGGSSNAAANTANTNSSKMSEEDKKAQEERAKLVAETEAKNKKIGESNATIQKALAEGNEAFNGKNYDLAIVKYEEGYQASPDFVGSAPVLLNNKGAALMQRAVGYHNQANKSTDTTAKVEFTNKSRKDFSDALTAYSTSWTILKNAPAADVTDQQSFASNKKQTLFGARDTIKYIILTEKLDPSKISDIAALLGEYIVVETDAAKKSESEVFLGDIYRINGDSQNAIAEYKKVLEKSPTNADALAGLGLSQANAGYNTDGSVNEAMMQEAINNLQRFTEVAPADHKLKVSVKETVDYLKSQNFKPQKTTKKKS